VIPQIVFIALSTLVSEDLTCIAAGVLIAQHRIGFAEGTVGCLLGIFIGDLLLFLAGRVAGRAALRWRPIGRLLSPDRLDRASAWLAERGLPVVFLSRFTPGLRLPTYFTAGLLSTSFWSFAAYLLVACAVWTPLVVAGTVLLGDNLLRTVFTQSRQGLAGFAVVCGAAIVAFHMVRSLLTFSSRRRLIGFLKRKSRWEFWPPWAAYLPLIPYLLYLALRHRSLTVFTAANPGIFAGGLLGESKSAILGHLSSVEGAVPSYDLIPAELSFASRLSAARDFMAGIQLNFPVVLKPDQGERGSGVAIVRSDAELETYLTSSTADVIIQKHIGGLEFGVFYYRFPHEPRGRIFSITAKHFPSLTGDGRTSLRDLILRDSRAVCLARAYEQLCPRPMSDVPSAGETVQLVEIGSHCRGAVFLDATELKTPTLEAAIERISQAHPGFYFGRYDIRVPSIEDFQQGRALSVIELNGVAAEATHIYDPSVSVLEAYRVMFAQWRIAFEIGAMNRSLGAQPLAPRLLAAIILDRLGLKTNRQPVAAARPAQELV
jgi:membrane protein DedA with SNARE-associated domain